MDRNKFIAATVTTLILFGVVRFFTPSPENQKQNLKAPSGMEPLPKEVFLEPKLNTAVKDKSPVETTAKHDHEEPLQQHLIAPLKNLQPKKSTQPEQSQFNVKSDFVYFKIKDGLALVGGDVVLGELSSEQIKTGKFNGNLLKDKPSRSKLWPSAYVPFGFSVGFPQILREKVLSAIQYLNQETVMNFVAVDLDQDEDVVVFKWRDGAPCSSYLGRVGGLQPIYLNAECSSQDVIHELMHALGFVHEQQRESRAEMVEILWTNIQKGFEYNFALLPDSMVHQYEGSVFRVSLNSVMMYHDDAFAVSGKKSMRAKNGAKINPISSGLAEIDKERLQLLYGL